MRRTAGVHVLGVAHDAYDFEGRAVLRHIQAEMFPDGILFREESFGEGLIHYSDTARGGGVFFADTPPAQNWLAHGFKISGLTRSQDALDLSSIWGTPWPSGTISSPQLSMYGVYRASASALDSGNPCQAVSATRGRERRVGRSV